MPNFSSIFSRTPRVVAPQPVVASPRTVGQTVGASFKFGPAIGVNKAFSRRMLKWCVKEFSPENVLFLVMCDKFASNLQNTTEALFLTIYTDFVDPLGRYQVNLKGTNSTALTAVRTRITAPCAPGAIPPPPPYPDTFNTSVWEIQKLIDADSGARLKTQPWESAFRLTKPAEIQAYNDGIAYLQGHGITLHPAE